MTSNDLRECLIWSEMVWMKVGKIMHWFMFTSFMISEIVLTCRWSYLPYILDSTPIHIMSDDFFMNNHAAGSSENTEKNLQSFFFTRECQLLRLRSTQIISYCVTSLFNQGQVRVFWFLETRPKNNRSYDNRDSNETEIRKRHLTHYWLTQY